MTETQTVESIEADNQTKREVLASLKAREANVILSGALQNQTDALLAEGKLLDGQIDHELGVLVGHGGIASTDVEAAKSQMLAAVEKQVVESDAAATKAREDAAAQDAINAEQRAADELAAENKAEVDAAARVDEILNVPAPEVPPEVPVPVTEVPVLPSDPSAAPTPPATPDLTAPKGV